MKDNFFILVAFLFLYGKSFSQEKMIRGKVFGDGNNVEGINIVNLVNEKAAVTDSNGEFQILVKPEDMLIFSSLFFEYKRKIIEAEDLRLAQLDIVLVPKPIELDEVAISQYVKMSAVQLGILKKQPKTYTVAQRRMISKIGSRNDRKNALIIEGKVMLIEKLDVMVEDEYFINTLKINPEYVLAFKFFCAEHPPFLEIAKTNNSLVIIPALKELASKYNYLQNQ